MFSDILVVPHALGQRLRSRSGEGPQLDPIADRMAFERLRSELDHDVLAPVYETIRIVKRQLDPAVALLGFCGAPWTVASYMIAGHGTPDQAPARLFAYRDAAAFAVLIDVLVEASAGYLVRQLQAGADAVQIFDTWAGVLPPERIRALVHRADAADRRLGAGRGAGREDHRLSARGRDDAAALCGGNRAVDAVGLDWMVDKAFARDASAEQGAGAGQSRSAGAGRRRCGARPRHRCGAGGVRRRPFIFNLGHGIVPETPIAHVEQMLRARVRGPSDLAMLLPLGQRPFTSSAVIAWMAGMLYLPRLFVYHCAAEPGSKQSETFKVMERRLLRAIINPAMVATWVLGFRWLA